MEVKGTAVMTTRDFVKAKFPDRYNAWMDSLPPATKNLLSGSIMTAGWYPLKDGYTVPIDKIRVMFYAGDAKTCGDALGKYSADIVLHGIYKAFLMIASPKFLMQRASSIMSNYYKPSEIKTVENNPKNVALLVTQFEGITETLEYRFAGWVVRALELANCKNVRYSITKALSHHQDKTEIVFSWD